jgi:hypothetical protein
MSHCCVLDGTGDDRRLEAAEVMKNGWNRKWGWFRKDSAAVRLVAVVVLMIVFVAAVVAEFDDT